MGKFCELMPKRATDFRAIHFLIPKIHVRHGLEFGHWDFEILIELLCGQNRVSHFSGEGNPGVLFIGDVGDGGWEEMNISREGGENFGWPFIEGLYINWGFYNRPIPDNQLIVNPLFEIWILQSRIFYIPRIIFFEHCLKVKRILFQTLAMPPNLCLIRLFQWLKTLPEITWSHAKWNLPTRAEVPYFNDENKIRGYEISDPESGVLGENFGGFSSLAGAFYTGSKFPEEYHDSYFAFDFSGWIRKFEFDENHHLISVESFYEEVEKVIHLTENATEGCLYFINLKGEIRKICYGGNPAPNCNRNRQ